MASTEPRASLERVGASLRLRGQLDRATVTQLWPHALQALDGANALALAEISAIDSAGLAMLAELHARLRERGVVAISGDPPGLAGLCAAYRMSFVANAALDVPL